MSLVSWFRAHRRVLWHYMFIPESFAFHMKFLQWEAQRMYLVAGAICLVCFLLHLSNFFTRFSEGRDTQYLTLGLIAWPVPGIASLMWSGRGRRWVKAHYLVWHGHLAVLVCMWCSRMAMDTIYNNFNHQTWNVPVAGLTVMLLPLWTPYLKVLIMILYVQIAIHRLTTRGMPLPWPDMHVTNWVGDIGCPLILAWIHAVSTRQMFLVTEALAAESEAHQRAKEEIESAQERDRRFFALLSHEMRTPLGGLLGFLELLQGTDLTDEQSGFLRHISSSTMILKTVINDILDTFKLQAGKFSLDVQEVHLLSAVEQWVNAAQAYVESQKLQFRYTLVGELPERVLLDVVRVQQVLSNLISNAVKFTEAGHVSLAMEVLPGSKQSLKVAVEDTGIGVAEMHQGQLFQAFMQADVTISRRFGGTGLGLAIVKDLVSLMGGEVGFEPREGRGSRFWFLLPLQVQYGPSGGMPHAVLAPHHLHRKYKVMVVDDIPLNLRLVSSMAQKLGFDCICMPSGQATVQFLQDHPTNHGLDLVLMDLWMPEMTGFEAAKAIQRIDKSIPVLACSADVNTMEQEVKAAGMRGIIAKPLTKATLINALNEHGRSTRMEAGPSSVDEVHALRVVEVEE
uniref:histidine kinase n=1 Tax=Eutreptiella gymnastica TaxID=73025 RepID=A0A7S1IQ28_9EUGL|mmetsp:Transcript_33192/g.59433  ORF Transcript_33192/g.59433 Transcript_33192/m.59433 type:complete len:623 (+) Transcript_33192:17-1885(+)